MSELNLKFGENQKSIPAPASVADALKAFDRDAAKKSLAAKVNGEEVDLNKQLDATDRSFINRTDFARNARRFGIIRHSTAHLLAAAVLDLFPGTQARSRSRADGRSALRFLLRRDRAASIDRSGFARYRKENARDCRNAIWFIAAKMSIKRKFSIFSKSATNRSNAN